MNIYRFKNWSKRYEVAQSRPVKKWSWLPLPLTRDETWHRRVLQHPNAAAILGVMGELLKLAATCPVRGDLASEDGAYSVEDLIDLLGLPAAVVEEALQVLTSERVGVILIERYENAPGTLERASSTLELPDRTGPDQTTQLETGSSSASIRTGQTQTAEEPATGVFAGVIEETLRSNEALNGWYRCAVKKPRPVVGACEANELRVFAAAERALEQGDDPAHLFGYIVGKAAWHLITQAHEERARKRLNELRGVQTLQPTRRADADAATASARTREVKKLEAAVRGP